MAETKEVATVEPSESTNLMQQMIAAARDIDTDKLGKLMDMNDRLLADQRRAAFAKDFAAMKPKLPRIIKRRENKQTQSKYANLGDTNTEVDPILAEFGFGTKYNVSQTPEAVTVICELWHRDGHVENSGPFTIPIDNKGPQGTVNKSMPHGIMSATEYAKRGSLGLILNISTGDDVDGNTANDLLTEEFAKDITQRIKALPDAEAYMTKFKEYMKIESVDQILAKDYMKAIGTLKVKENKKPKGEAK